MKSLIQQLLVILAGSVLVYLCFSWLGGRLILDYRLALASFLFVAVGAYMPYLGLLFDRWRRSTRK